MCCGGSYLCWWGCFCYLNPQKRCRAVGSRMTTLVAALLGDTGDRRHQPFLGSSPRPLLQRSWFCNLKQNVSSLLQKHTYSYIHTGKYIIFALSFSCWHKKIYDRCHSDTILSQHNKIQVNLSVISHPVILMDEMNNIKNMYSSAWSEEPLLRWVGGCGVEMLINYSVWLS